jgi:hypothetical protein
MAKNAVLKFEGDIRAWLLNPSNGAKTPVVDDALDIYGNIPLEANASVFSYEAGEEVTVLSKRRDRYNQAIFAEQEPGLSSLSLTLVAVPPAVLARVFYGEAATIDVTGAAVTNEAVVFTADELSQPLGHQYIAASPAPVVTNVAGDTTYVADTDYVIDRRLGRIRRLAGGAITATGTVHVDYTYTTYSLVEIRGGVKPQETFYLLGDFKNRPDASDMYLEVYQANLATDGEVDLFASEPITVTLTGPLITPEDKTEPYKVRIKEAA